MTDRLGWFLLLMCMLTLAVRDDKCVSAQFANEFAPVEPPQYRIPGGGQWQPPSRFYSRAHDQLDEHRQTLGNQFNAIKMRTFKLFAQMYNKTYSARELPKRFGLFLQRRKLIERSIRLFREGRASFTLRENAFVDWTHDELRRLAGVVAPRRIEDLFVEEQAALVVEAQQRREAATSQFYNQPITIYRARRFKRDLSALDADDDSLNRTVGAQQQQQLQDNGKLRIPARMDWRTSGCVADPVDQLECGACYAIATVGVLESMQCLHRVPGATTLAPQQLVDCSANYKNLGCDGGWPTGALKYLRDVHWVARSGCYPFKWRQDQCRLGQVFRSRSAECFVSASSGGQQQLRFKVLTNERDILYHVAKTGPVVSVMKTTDKFLYYGSGIFDDPACSRQRDDVDHAIVIVGYGRDGGQDYWLVKNSWGASWGENGYARVRRGTNACSIGHWAWVVLN